MNKMTQNTKVLKYMELFGGITTKEAMERLGVYRLSGRIFDLKKMGHCIKTTMVDVPCRDGDTTKVARYSLC